MVPINESEDRPGSEQESLPGPESQQSQSGAESAEQAPDNEQSVLDSNTGPEESQQQPGQISLDERNLSILVHLLGLIGIFGPLIVWLLTRDKYDYVDKQGKESVNWQISLMIYLAICGVLFPLAPILVPLLVILNTIFVILATLRASEGNYYRYPLAFHLLK